MSRVILLRFTIPARTTTFATSLYTLFKCLCFRLQLTMDVAAHTSSHTTVSAEEHRKRVVDIPFLTRTCIRIIERMNVGRAIAFTHV